MSWKRSLVLLLLVLACRKTTRDLAREYIDDTSLATPVALAKAAAVYYPDAKTWAEGAEANWRVFVVVDRTNTPSIAKTGSETTITYYEALDGEALMHDAQLLGLAAKRGVGEVLVAERYHASIDGRPLAVLKVRRTRRAGGQSVQTLSDWPPEDLAKAKPYDMMMNEKSVVIPGAR